MLVLSSLWLCGALFFVLYEISNIRQAWLVVFGIVTIVLLVALHAFYFYIYFKNKNKVRELQQKYLDSLKPDKPLRFCDSDEELMKKYLAKKEAEKAVLNQKKIVPSINKEEAIKDAEEEEMEIS